nr:MAG TPA: hypothetical protein [Caudoviricetes sp.]
MAATSPEVTEYAQLKLSIYSNSTNTASYPEFLL